MRPDILTAAGFYFDFTQPLGSLAYAGEARAVQAIAHGLSQICRFGGHTRAFYSVAQHSVIVSRIVPPEHAMAALMHDAHEAFTGDIPAPLKALLPDYRALESRIECAVRDLFYVQRIMPACVKHADLVALATEQRDLMPPHDDEWAVLQGIAPLADTIIPLPPIAARALFWDRYRELVTIREGQA